jgi:putative flavoprotein involved in K+ transport
VTGLVAERIGTVVVGGGAGGLAAGWQLKARGYGFAVLDASGRVGDSWRGRYDCLRLFTPARFCGLPGQPLPMPPMAHPSRDDLADYLTAYADRAGLDVRLGTTVTGHRRDGGRHVLTVPGATIEADRVIVATGISHRPAVPAFAPDLAPAIHQVHSSAYRRPDDLPPGPVLVVGAGTSGADIALDLAPTHPTSLSGRPTGHVPIALVRNAAFRRLVYRRRTPRGPLGRLIRHRIHGRGSPLTWQTERELTDAGIVRVPRTVGVRDGCPVLADGRALAVASVVWCTGFRPDYGWLDPRAVGPDGWPLQRHGTSRTVPGLYFVGLPLQHTLESGFLGGMSTDAAYVVAQFGRHSAERPLIRPA